MLSLVVQVDSITGLVRLAQPLDFEKKQRYEVALVAADDSQLTGEAKLVLTVSFFFLLARCCCHLYGSTSNNAWFRLRTLMMSHQSSRRHSLRLPFLTRRLQDNL